MKKNLDKVQVKKTCSSWHRSLGFAIGEQSGSIFKKFFATQEENINRRFFVSRLPFLSKKYSNFHATKPTFENLSSLCQILITNRQESNFSMFCSMLS